jgi:hypothetical protein
VVTLRPLDDVTQGFGERQVIHHSSPAPANCHFPSLRMLMSVSSRTRVGPVLEIAFAKKWRLLVLFLVQQEDSLQESSESSLPMDATAQRNDMMLLWQEVCKIAEPAEKRDGDLDARFRSGLLHEQRIDQRINQPTHLSWRHSACRPRFEEWQMDQRNALQAAAQFKSQD